MARVYHQGWKPKRQFWPVVWPLLLALGFILILGLVGRGDLETELRLQLADQCNYRGVPTHNVDCRRAIDEATHAGYEVIYNPKINTYTMEAK